MRRLDQSKQGVFETLGPNEKIYMHDGLTVLVEPVLLGLIIREHSCFSSGNFVRGVS
jgi:hypothetical protein